MWNIFFQFWEYFSFEENGNYSDISKNIQKVKTWKLSILDQNMSKLDMFWYKLPQKWGRIVINFGQKFQNFKSFIFPKIQAQYNEYGSEEKKLLLHMYPFFW